MAGPPQHTLPYKAAPTAPPQQRPPFKLAVGPALVWPPVPPNMQALSGQLPVPLLTTAQLDAKVVAMQVQQLEFEMQQTQHLQEPRARLLQEPAAKKPRPPDAPQPPCLMVVTEHPRQPAAPPHEHQALELAAVCGGSEVASPCTPSELQDEAGGDAEAATSATAASQQAPEPSQSLVAESSEEDSSGRKQPPAQASPSPTAESADEAAAAGSQRRPPEDAHLWFL